MLVAMYDEQSERLPLTRALVERVCVEVLSQLDWCRDRELVLAVGAVRARNR